MKNKCDFFLTKSSARGMFNTLCPLDLKKIRCLIYASESVHQHLSLGSVPQHSTRTVQTAELYINKTAEFRSYLLT